VSVDCGITALEEAEECRRLGLDLIVTDHHLPRPEGLPVCSAVVNPNRPDCTSGLSFLSGVGVGFYLLMGLRQAMRQEGFKFRESVEVALSCGVDSITDLAESKLVTHINNGSLRAIQYWLDNHKKEYIRPRNKDMWKKPFVPISSITINTVDPLNMPPNVIGDINDDDGYGE
jgi:single-stranded DNA-specific DHH superfamily exonuclease